MTNSKIDPLILDGGWKGTLTRVVVIALVYLGMKFLPNIVGWLSAHTSLSPMSAQQTERHGAILVVFQIVFGFALVFEVVRSLYVFFEKRKGK
ncbi:hypothetical protein [Paraburkholderia terrae]|jgi:hypothetical protein|uniref:hypothetical protein n=1 Tax=Paraburkholderia terrae TaxID=311230 RepID=UPI001EE326BD|nr:hypothetical protein [Paraburkholderia terrae]GJH05732.1 hypothetical protein CBA19C8_34265 [Paraburkholderia terrae]